MYYLSLNSYLVEVLVGTVESG